MQPQKSRFATFHSPNPDHSVPLATPSKTGDRMKIEEDGALQKGLIAGAAPIFWKTGNNNKKYGSACSAVSLKR